MKSLIPALMFVLPAVCTAAQCTVVDPELQGTYDGGCRNGLAHGYGHAVGTAEYRGEFHKGLKEGTGTKTWAWGDRYEGGFLDDRKHGKGMYIWGAGSPWAGERYVGEYRADQREGTGAYYWPNGDRFEGQWKADRRYGYSAMELRRQAADKARTAAFVAGTQVCAWGKIGIAHDVLRVGRVEAFTEGRVQVRLLRTEGAPAGAADAQAGTLMTTSAYDWSPCL